MKDTKVLVIGDVMVDMYEHCVVKRISPEAPVPVAMVIDDSWFLGGAANVASNVRALGAEVSLVSVIGNDRDGTLLQELLHTNGINYEGLVIETGRVTTLKKRVVSGTQQLMRIDREMTDDVTEETEDAVLRVVVEKIKDHDVVIISDYCKGLLTERVVEEIKREAGAQNKKVFVDSKNRQFVKYSNFYLIKPNKEEAEYFVGEKFVHTYENLEGIGKKLGDIFQSNVVITLGGDGIALFENGQFHHMKTEALQVFDVSGAGDTVLAVIATAVAAGAGLKEAVHLSNIAAGHVVSRLGTTVCTHDTLRQIIGA